jgi:hypothetical protein
VATATLVGINSIGLALGQRPDGNNRPQTVPRKRKQLLQQPLTISTADTLNRAQAGGTFDAAGVEGRRQGMRLGERTGTGSSRSSAGPTPSTVTSFWTSSPETRHPNLQPYCATFQPASLTKKPTTNNSLLDEHQRHDTGRPFASPTSSSSLVTMTTNIHPSLRPAHALGATSHPRASHLPPSTSSSFQSQPRQSYDGRTVSGKVRRLTLSAVDASEQRRQDFDRDGSSTAGTLDEVDPPHRLRTRPSSSRNSWMKRLSSAMSSRSASPAPSDGVSADISFSTTSKTFSHHSSNAPILGSRPPTAPSGPNKLVKRTSSQGVGSDALLSTSGRLALRRPATSHQRSAALQHHSSLRDTAVSAASPPEDLESTSQTKWRQYFSIKVPKFARSQKRHATHDGTTIRRILPEDGPNPTLMSTKANLTCSVDIEDLPEQDEMHFSGRPLSALGLEIHEMLPDHPSPNPDSLASGDSGKGSMDLGTSSRFSIQGLLRRRSSRIAEQRRPAKLVKRSSRRVFSDPLVVGDVDLNVSDDERPAKRRHAANDNNGSRLVDAQNITPHEVDTNFTALSSAFTASPTTFNSGHSSPYMTSATNSPDFPQYQFQGKICHPLSTFSSAPKSQSLSRLHMRASTASAAASEPTSTLVGSEVEIGRGVILVDDEDTDQSTLFDSLRTRGTRSTSGAHRGRIETIFDESPSPPCSSSPRLRDILPDGMLGGQEPRRKEHHSPIDDECNMATPVRTIRSIRSDRADDGSPLAPRLKSRHAVPLHLSSPPSMQKALSLGTLEYDDELEEDDDESRWSCFDDDSKLSLSDEIDALEEQSIADMDWANSKRASINSTTTTSTSRGVEGKETRKDTKSKLLFDWSEQSTEKGLASQSPPRPRTVHGSKKNAADRGSRSNGRRIPSGLHARSQSVPVVPGLSGKRETVMTNKFGTWGVGSKGVSEDWDEDFDFGDDGPQPSTTAGGREEKRIDSGVVMHIPQTIRESQVNVVNNIGLVREFYKLIEELKVLRMRATQDGQIQSSIPAVWSEIDAMIDLADQEVDDPLFPAQTSLPASPAHEPDPFDEGTETVRRPSFPKITPDPRRSRSRRRSVLPNAENDVFSTPASQTTASQVTESSPKTIKTRPRKDSEAMARSVIEAVQRKKEPTDSNMALQSVASNKKVPFDTNTLRHIVPYVNNLVRKVRASMNDHETLNETSHASTVNEQTRLSQLFNHPPNVSPLQQKKSRRPDVKSGNAPRGKENEAEDISKKMNNMNLI